MPAQDLSDLVIRDFADYICPQGLVCSAKNPTSPEGNSILRTAQYVMILDHYSPSLKDNFILQIAENIRNECQITPGLFRRAKNWVQDQEGRDDYIGLALMSFLFCNPWAKEILDFGSKNTYQWGPFKFRYAYNNRTYDSISSKVYMQPPQADCWLGRHIELITSLEWSSGKTPSLFHRLWWSISTAMAGSLTDQDGWILTDMMIRICGKRGIMEMLAVACFRHRLKKTWRGGIRQVLGMYFQNVNHPIAKWWPEN